MTTAPPRPARGTMVLAPHGDLIAGGPAEDLEQQIRTAFAEDRLHLVVDLHAVTRLDSSGIRSLIRGHTTAQRVGGTFTVVAPSDHVRKVLQVGRLDSVLAISDSLRPVRNVRRSLASARLVLAAVGVVAALVGAGFLWPIGPSAPAIQVPGITDAAAPAPVDHWMPLAQLARLIGAAGIGLLVTMVQRRVRREKPQTQAIEHAQVLLCVAGALMMVIVGDSVARAFGIAGAASIIRFRTPIEDPKDTTILFLLVGLGMSVGLGAFTFAGLAAAFLCLFLIALDRFGARKPRAMMVEMATSRQVFPSANVEAIFARNHVMFEPREISHGKHTVARYHTTIEPGVSLEDLSEQLVGDAEAAITSVEWEAPRKGE